MKPSKDRLKISEIFFSIQGESTLSGLPCVFVRLSSCDLRCAWCDTAYAFEGGTEMPAAEVMENVEKFKCGRVEITGGEPLLQENIYHLMRRLCDDGYEVLIETGGHHDIGKIDPRVRRIMDIKCPGSGMQKYNRWENIGCITVKDEIKFVISDRRDYEWAREMTEKHNLTARCPVLFSPVFGKLENRALAEWILQDKLNVRFQIQMHKYIWDPDKRGV
jgi:7-carboxy-7-deazaguanine synthase